MIRPGRLARRIGGQRGATFVELIIALGIASLIAVAVVVLIRQVLMLNQASSGHMDAIKQVENALHYLNRDIQMASPFQSQLPASSATLTLRWTDYQDNRKPHVVTYATGADGSLRRTESIDGAELPARVVATHVVAAGYSYNGQSVTINLTVTFEGMATPATETRTLEVKLRSSS